MFIGNVFSRGRGGTVKQFLVHALILVSTDRVIYNTDHLIYSGARAPFAFDFV